MDAIGSSPQLQTSLAPNASNGLNETPKKSEEVPTLNQRDLAVQESPDSQANSTATGSQQEAAGLGTSSNPQIDQQLRQAALRAQTGSDDQQDTNPAQGQGNSQQAIDTFKAVEQFESGSTSAVTDTAGLAAQNTGVSGINAIA